MDSITQAALGASIGEVTLSKHIGNKGALFGALVATLPDLDVIFIPLYDNLQRITIHRGYSHSFLVCLILSVMLSVLFKQLKWTKGVPISLLWLFNFLALSTHVILDAFTTYGTQLFLPFSNARVSFDSITIIDPVYTLPLIIGLAFSLYFKSSSINRSKPTKIALLISSLYLGFTLLNKQHINGVFEEKLQAKEVENYQLLTVPVSAANLWWYGAAKTDSGLYLGSYSILKPKKPVEWEFFESNDMLLEDLNSELIAKMKWFSKDFYWVTEYHGNIRLYNLQCDMQGIQRSDYIAPTAFYFEITPEPKGKFELSTGMHRPKK